MAVFRMRGLSEAKGNFRREWLLVGGGIAAVMALLLPRWWWAFYILAAGVGVERVMEGAHYPSDVAAAMVLGVLAAIAAWRVLEPRPREPVGFDVIAVSGNS